jgi:hypothetical protein
MKFSSFKRPAYTRPPVSAARPIRQVTPTVFTDLVMTRPKEDAVRSEPYRRLVAAMPCKACGIQGYSQAAHLPTEGKGIKQDDRLTFPLCCTRPDITGCHADYDQYRLFSRPVAMTVGRAWAADTRRQISATGQWPKNLPIFETVEVIHV